MAVAHRKVHVVVKELCRYIFNEFITKIHTVIVTLCNIIVPIEEDIELIECAFALTAAFCTSYIPRYILT